MSRLRVIGFTAVLPLLGACGITSRIEPYKQTDAVIAEGEHVVVLARKQHSTHEAEEDFVQCLSDGLADGKNGLDVHSSKDFEDKMYPWFEPSTAPLSTEDLTVLLARPGVLDQVRTTGVRYVIWVDGSTDRVASGGGITCAAGVGGAGCMGLAWWEDDSRYDFTVWDIKDVESEGTIHADVQGPLGHAGYRHPDPVDHASASARVPRAHGSAASVPDVTRKAIVARSRGCSRHRLDDPASAARAAESADSVAAGAPAPP